MNFDFTGTIWFWKGPAPWYFVTVPEKACEDLKAMSGAVTYGWGMIPVNVKSALPAGTPPCGPRTAVTSSPSKPASAKQKT